MKIYRTESSAIVLSEKKCYVLENADWDQLINRNGLHGYLQSLISKLPPAGNESILETFETKAPIKSQEIWAAGVTYLKSKTARRNFFAPFVFDLKIISYAAASP